MFTCPTTCCIILGVKIANDLMINTFEYKYKYILCICMWCYFELAITIIKKKKSHLHVSQWSIYIPFYSISFYFIFFLTFLSLPFLYHICHILSLLLLLVFSYHSTRNYIKIFQNIFFIINWNLLKITFVWLYTQLKLDSALNFQWLCTSLANLSDSE